MAEITRFLIPQISQIAVGVDGQFTSEYYGYLSGLEEVSKRVMANVTFGNIDSEISSLTFSATPTQAEAEALRDKCEELADDVRNLRAELLSAELMEPD